MKKKSIVEKEAAQANALMNYCANHGIIKENRLFGNDYFNDIFSVIGFLITIDFIDSPYAEAVQKNADFLKFMKKQDLLTCNRVDNAYNPHYLYQVFFKSDYIALTEQGNRVREAAEKFNQWYHYLREKYGAENVMCA